MESLVEQEGLMKFHNGILGITLVMDMMIQKFMVVRIKNYVKYGNPSIVALQTLLLHKASVPNSLKACMN